MATNQAAKGGAAKSAETGELSLLDRIVQEGKMAIEPNRVDSAL